MVLRFFMLAGIFFFVSCSDVERNNPNDPGSDNYRGWQIVSPLSSTAVRSSSSVAPSSSSVMVSSSSANVPSSSSNVPPSSSSVAPSFSSAVVSSSSSKPSSSSSSVLSSSSAKVSSSSVVISSSSSAVAGVGLCGGFVDGTPREHYGISKPQFCDSRDGKKYVYVTIGNQTWMAENLNYNASYSKCGDGNSLSDANTTICDTYGRLYYGTDTEGICPIDWHIPSGTEWATLKIFVGTNTGKKLKAKEGWNSGGNGEDKFGFTALPGGAGNFSSVGGFNSVGIHGFWWGKWAGGSYSAGANISNTDDNLMLAEYSTTFMYSVRCVRD